MRKSALILAGLLLLAAGTLSGVVHAASAVGQVTHLSGTLTAKRADGSIKLFSVKSEVQEGDTLSTEQDTYARIKFADGGEVVLRPGSQLKVAAYAFDQAKPQSDNIVLNMLKGGLRAVTGPGRQTQPRRGELRHHHSHHRHPRHPLRRPDLPERLRRHPHRQRQAAGERPAPGRRRRRHRGQERGRPAGDQQPASSVSCKTPTRRR